MKATASGLIGETDNEIRFLKIYDEIMDGKQTTLDEWTQ